MHDPWSVHPAAPGRAAPTEPPPHRRLCAAAVVLLIAGSRPGPAQETITIDRDNIVVTRSVRIQPGVYQVQDADGNGVLQVGSEGVEIDFQGATLQSGDPERLDLTAVKGIGIAIAGHRNVTIRNARIHGYGHNIRAERAPELTLQDCDVGRSLAHRIAAGGVPVETWLVLRSLADWRRYGAGLWIEACDGSAIRRCRGHGAQNGLLLVGSARCAVTECDFSCNSGWGVGLWQASDNVVAWNRIDFVNRPWGGGWGGDSAALVVVDGSHGNMIVGNSITHSGDGFFLTDRDNGGFSEQNPVTRFVGSCDRNVVAHNDGSWSPCNAFEGTFSFGNVYYRNLAEDSGYGFWLGYSSDTLLLANEIRRNLNDGIAIEHGHGNRIEQNRLEQNRGTAIALWSSGPDWLLALHPSRDSDLRGNVLRDNGRAFRLQGSTAISAADNDVGTSPGAEWDFVERPAPATGAGFEQSPQMRRLEQVLASRPASFRLLRDEPGPKGRQWIVADEYAPRDYRHQLVAVRNRDPATLELLAIAEGELRIEAPDWIEVRREAALPGFVAAARQQRGPGEARDYTLVVRTAAGGRSQRIAGTLLTVEWDVSWYRWDQPELLAYDDAAGWRRLFATPPLHRQRTSELTAELWTRSRPPAVPGHHFALTATTRVRLPSGRYRLSTVSDDGLRVFLDGVEVISRWNHHGPTPDQVELDIGAGVHEWSVHYCQEDGASALSFGWQVHR